MLWLASDTIKSLSRRSVKSAVGMEGGWSNLPWATRCTGQVHLFHIEEVDGPLCGAKAILSAASISIPRYRTVLSSLVCPSSSRRRTLRPAVDQRGNRSRHRMHAVCGKIDAKADCLQLDVALGREHFDGPHMKPTRQRELVCPGAGAIRCIATKSDFDSSR